MEREVGLYKNAGREWRTAGDPVRVNVHDFANPELGKANPYGVCDVTTSDGWLSVGTDHDTAALAEETGLSITVCHLPPGTSKWNKIEHRLFSHIPMNGLTVHAELDDSIYPTGIMIGDTEMVALPIDRHEFHGEWNGTIKSDETRLPRVKHRQGLSPIPFSWRELPSSRIRHCLEFPGDELREYGLTERYGA